MHSNRLAIFILAAALAPAALSQQPCTFSLAPPSATVGANGGNGNIVVTASAQSCTRTATPTVPWISITQGQTGAGSGLVSWSVAANPTLSERSGAINIGGATFTITQAAGTCTFTLSRTSDSFSASGGTGSFNVTTPPGCTWTAVSSAEWVTITAGGSGTGTATIVFAVAANPTVIARSATITVGSATFTITQTASSCLSLSSTSVSVPAGGGASGFNVIASADCSWTAISNADWVLITSGGSGTGPGTVSFTAAANPSPIPRSGTISIGSLTFTINQPANACFTLSGTSGSVPATGGSGSFGVTATAGCSWTAVSNAEWLTITGGVAGTGPGTVAYTAAANTTTGQRTGIITVGSQTFTVTQPAACLLTLSPAAAAFGASGGTGSITVSASAGACERLATTTTSWITITAGASGSGNGTINYTVAANATGQPRSGSIDISGLTFSVTQAGTTCSLILSPPTRSFTAAGGSGAVTVTTSCAWTATSNADWIQITTGASGTGNGNISYFVLPNPTPTPRTGAILVGEQAFTISEAGVSCEVQISATTAALPAAGGPGSVDVTASGSCTWTAVSAASWISITGEAGGTGEGIVSFSVAANNTPQVRSGTITIGNQILTITQPGTSCSYSLSSTGASVPATGGSGSFTVTTNCNWTAVPSASWLTISAGAGGNGDGTISYSAAANPGTNARTGTITVGDRTFTVSQPGASCTITLTPGAANVPGVAGTGSLNVTAPSGCSWTPASEAEWLKITAWSSVSGTGTVSYSYTTNPSQTPRTATITVAGQTFTVTQGAAEVRVSSVVNAASGARGVVAPGLIVALGGLGMGPARGLTADRTVTTTLAGVRVLFDDAPAPVLYASDGQVNAIVPYAVDGRTVTQLQVEYQGVRSQPLGLNVQPAAPGLFSLDSSGAGPGAILNEDYSVNSAANAAAKNSVIILYATGEGQTQPAGVDGRITGETLPTPVLPAAVQIGGVDAPVLYAGGAPGLVAGVMQVNVRVPARAPSGNAVPVLLRVGRFESQPGITVAVK